MLINLSNQMIPSLVPRLVASSVVCPMELRFPAGNQSIVYYLPSLAAHYLPSFPFMISSVPSLINNKQGMFAESVRFAAFCSMLHCAAFLSLSLSLSPLAVCIVHCRLKLTNIIIVSAFRDCLLRSRVNSVVSD